MRGLSPSSYVLAIKKVFLTKNLFFIGAPLGTYTNADAFAVLAAMRLEHFADEPSAGCFIGRSGPFGFESLDCMLAIKKVFLTKNLFYWRAIRDSNPKPPHS